MRYKGRKPRARPKIGRSLVGVGLLDRMRSRSFALLGATAAIGFGLVAVMAQQNWPYLPVWPIPGISAGQEAVHGATAVAVPRVRVAPGDSQVGVPVAAAPLDRGSGPPKPTQTGSVGSRHPVVGATPAPGSGGEPAEPGTPTPAEPPPSPEPVPAPVPTPPPTGSNTSAPTTAATTPPVTSTTGSPGGPEAGEESGSGNGTEGPSHGSHGYEHAPHGYYGDDGGSHGSSHDSGAGSHHHSESHAPPPAGAPAEPEPAPQPVVAPESHGHGYDHGSGHGSGHFGR